MIAIEIKRQPALLLLAISVLLISACKDKFEGSKEDDRQQLERLMAEIKAISEQEKCVNSADWKFLPIGSKACGGPTGIVTYSVKIDTTAFLEKVNKYTKEQAAFNKKWKIVSDCSVLLPPKSIICENEKPKLVYDYDY